MTVFSDLIEGGEEGEVAGSIRFYETKLTNAFYDKICIPDDMEWKTKGYVDCVEVDLLAEDEE